MRVILLLSLVQTGKKSGANREITSSKKRPNSGDTASISVLPSCFLRVSTVFLTYMEHEGNTVKIRCRYDEIAMEYAVFGKLSKSLLRVLSGKSQIFKRNKKTNLAPPRLVRHDCST